MKIFVAGHKGMVGAAIIRALRVVGDNEVVTKDSDCLDLTVQQDVFDFIQKEKFEQVYICAAKVGGIFANSQQPAEFIYENLAIQNNLIHASFKANVQRLLFLGSSCIYPKFAQQPIKENALLSGKLEESNDAYAIAKIAGLKMVEAYRRQYNVDFRCLMPTNLYGPGDNFHPQNSHVLPALIQKFHQAKLSKNDFVTIWGTGSPEREFLHVFDLAEACIHIMNLDQEFYSKNVSDKVSHVNVGTGLDISIADLAKIIKTIVGFDGEIKFDTSKPNGTPKKVLDIRLIESLGWKHNISLHEGISSTYKWFVENQLKLRES